IVENAIQHGILQKPERSGTIRITGTKSGQVLVFKVADDGAGMSEETVADILVEFRHTDEFHGYGIKDTNERIALQYGPAIGLYYESRVGSGTTVTIMLPAVVKK